jgi:hypothetical protein
VKPAFYALKPGGWRDYVTLLHPPYTLWHLSYVVIGAALAPEWLPLRLGAGLLAFFLGLGVAAHALDELHGRPLRTDISGAVLAAVAAVGLVGALALGVVGIGRVGAGLLVFMAIGPVLVVGYNAELFGGRLHSDAGFAAAWGAFPVLTAYFVQAGALGLTAILAAAAAFALSLAQRSLSTRARLVRRQVARIEGTMTMVDGSVQPIDARAVLDPVERGLRWMSVATVVLAVALFAARG